MTIQQDIQQMNQTMSNFISLQSQIIQENQTSKKISENINSELRDHRRTITQGKELSDTQNKIVKKILKYKEDELRAENDYNRHKQHIIKLQDELISNATTLTGAQIDDINNQIVKARENSEIAKTEQNLYSTQRTKSEKLFNSHVVRIGGKFELLGSKMDGVSDLFGMLTKLSKFLSFFSILANQSISYLHTAQDVSKELGGVIEGSDFDKGMANFTNKLNLYGISDKKAMAQVAMETRQVSNAMGGFGNMLDTVKQQSYDMVMAYGGNLDESTKANIKIMNNLATKGFMPTSNSLKRFNTDLLNASRYGVREADKVFMELSEESGSINMLRLARDSERESILANQRAVLLHAKSLGMADEQAKAVASTMNKMSGEKALDRYKKGAKIMVAAGAIGMGAEGKAVFEEMRKNKSQQNLALINENMNLIANKMNQVQGNAFTSELMGDVLMDKTGTEEQFGPNSVFSSTLTQKLGKPLNKLEQSMTDATGSILQTGSLIESNVNSLMASLKDGTKSIQMLTHAIDNWTLNPISLAQDALESSGMEKTRATVWKGIKDISSLGGLINHPLSEFAGQKQYERTIAFMQQKDKEYDKTHYVSETEKLERSNRQSNLPTSKPIETPTKKSSEEVLKEKQDTDNYRKTANNSDVLITNSDKTVNKLDTQINHAVNTNDYLKQLVVGTTTIIDLAQKQLVASTTFGDEQKRYADYLRRSGGNGLSAEYQHV